MIVIDVFSFFLLFDVFELRFYAVVLNDDLLLQVLGVF